MKHWVIMAVMVVIFSLFMESCRGCAHRARRSHDRNSDRTEYRESNSRDEESSDYSAAGKLSGDRIAEIAGGDDYDEMLECLKDQISEIRNLRKKYFSGNMTDKEAQECMDEIVAKYAPITTRLDKASSEGLLNYKQHKKQMKYAGDLMKEMNEVVNRLGSDLDNALGY